MALWGNLKEAVAAELLRKWVDDADVRTAALVFDLVDRYFPDPTLARMRRLLANEDLRKAALPRLSHYYSRDLAADLRPLLRAESQTLQRCALVGLISQLSADDLTRAAVLERLKDRSADIREVAAEYFTWTGASRDLAALEDALGKEKDAYVRAALEAAISALQRRDKAAGETFRAGLDAIAGQETLEPLLVYNVHEHDRQPLFLDRNAALQRLILGSSIAIGAPSTKADYPAARSWLPPVRDYFSDERKSFGVSVGHRHATFAGSVHVGDDCA